MSTRGGYGFVKGNEIKVSYNHYDSYFSGLGFDIMKFVTETTDKEMEKIFDKIVMVKEDSIPTEEQIKECEQYLDLKVSTQDKKDWYCLLRNSQGELNEYKKELRYMIDNKEFLGDSLFCEYAYILNLDSKCLDIYTGFNENKNTNNLFTQFRNDEEKYVEVELLTSISFKKIRNLFKKLKEDDIKQELEKICFEYDNDKDKIDNLFN